MITCKFCNEVFHNETSLGIHRKLAHPDSAHPCLTCTMEFKNRSALYRHRKNGECGGVATVSANITEDGSRNVLQSSGVECGICECDVGTMEALCSHLTKEHAVAAEIQELSFPAKTEFVHWKNQIEENRRFQFVRKRTRETRNALIEYYYCHRSGLGESISAGKRAPKKLASVKIGFTCCAFATVTVSKESGLVSVKCCLDHYSHDQRLARLRIPDSMRVAVTSYYNDGRSADWILNKLRSEFAFSPIDDQEIDRYLRLTRQNIVTRQEIFNIVVQLGLRKDRLDENDAISVDLLIQRQNEGSFKPFFCYHPQKTCEDVFTIALQTQFQVKMLQTFGKRAICVDATHGTQRYHFLLVTVLVVDDFGRGYPVAWLVTSNETEELLERFFSELKERTGPIECDVFMSDDAPQYHKAWTRAYCSDGICAVPQKLLCVWHVLRNWRKQILAKVCKENIVVTWSTLAILLREPDQTIFNDLLTKFLTDLNASEPDFCEYFRREYLSSPARIMEWSLWARRGSIVNVNMFLEAFHRTLKKKFLNRNENHRLDFLLTTLLDVAQWYLSEYAITTERGGPANSYRLREMNERHRKSHDLRFDEMVNCVSADRWKVKSSSKKAEGTEYEVIKVRSECTMCQLKCGYCKVCPDMYDCTCPSSMFGSVACKHIHLIHATLSSILPVDHQSTPDFPAPMEINTPESRNYSGSTVPKVDVMRYMQTSAPRPETIESKKEKFQKLVFSVLNKIDTIQSVDVVEEACRKLSVVDTYLDLYGQSSAMPEPMEHQTVAPIKKMPTQQRFFQVRKKRRRAQNQLLRPDDNDIEAIRNFYSTLETEVCGVCFLEEPPTDKRNVDDDEIQWVDCDKCKIWFHQNCVDVPQAAGVFVCTICKQ